MELNCEIDYRLKKYTFTLMPLQWSTGVEVIRFVVTGERFSRREKRKVRLECTLLYSAI